MHRQECIMTLYNCVGWHHNNMHPTCATLSMYAESMFRLHNSDHTQYTHVAVWLYM